MSSGMNTKTLESFRTLVYEKSGIHLGPHKEALVSARISKRIRALNMQSAEAYLEHLSRPENENEIVHLIDAISTNVTSFFREMRHFDFMHQQLSQWYAQGQRRFRIWSAASSTGEEPYSIAITMAESLANNDCDTRILATDISSRVLDHGRRGVYAGQRLEGVDPQLRRRYFEEHRNGSVHFEAAVSLKRQIVFKRLNLAQPPYPMSGPFDIVFCRNVMIYFDSATREPLLREIHRLLRPGGFLFVGHAESLTGLRHSFKSIHPAIYGKE
jgi:chemotaxis protein methyltransferase CheR